jgi:hypothetical protein
MADERLEQALRFRPWHVGDPAVLVDSILAQVEIDQRKVILGHYLDSVAATYEANLKFVQGVRSVIGRAK